MRGKGEGSIFKDSRGYWTGVIELPSSNGVRNRVKIRRKSKAVLITDMEKERARLKLNGNIPPTNETVEEYLHFWVHQVAIKEVRPNTWDGYMRAVKNHIVPEIGNIKMKNLNGTHVARVHEAILKKKSSTGEPLSSTTALLAHRIMAKAFKVAVQRNRLDRNPTSQVDAPRKAVAAQDAFDLDESLALFRYVMEDAGSGARWATSLLTGARRGEVIGLELDRVGDHLDLSWQLQRLPVTDTVGVPKVPADFEYRHVKGGLYLTRPKSRDGWRVIPLVDPLKGILERHIANSEPNAYGLLFAPGGEPIDPDQDTKNWVKVLEASGINKKVVLHGLRHTAVDLLFLAGVPEDLVSQIVGHSNRATTRAYLTRGSLNRVRLDAAMQQFSALFATPTDAKPKTRELGR